MEARGSRVLRALRSAADLGWTLVKTLILCGGRGTRAYPHTLDVPKPLLEVGGRPVLSHLMEIYAAQGQHDFVLAGGYKIELLAAFAEGLPGEWKVDLIDTGEDTNTGGRVARCRDLLGETFFVTYADGLGDVDLDRLLRFHQEHPGSATVTTVPLPSPYGTLQLAADGKVEEFLEKPRLADHLINAGFFVFDQRAFSHWAGEDLERDVLPALGEAGQLYACQHPGFWKSMDTYKDALDLGVLCSSGRGPWMASD
jgi:glucose-1-phosphate cytidylyltransferase